MTEMSQYAPGTFCWQDLSTTDAAAAKQFYSGLFGWETFDIPMGPDAFYTMMRIGGKDVAGLSSQTQEMKDQGVPPFWTSYVSVTSADEAASKVKALGGQVLAEPFDVFGEGRMAVFQDPTGAAFAVWQPKNHIGSRLVNQPGALCWNELATTDAGKAKAFYTGLFGWNTEEMETEAGLYTLFLNGDRQNGGMMQMTEEWGNAPPHWMVYFAVEDCDRSVQKATELGAKVMVPPAEAGDIGRFSLLQDPQGAAFSIIKLYNPS
jgi:predicted enzyme related to lactoylglutathione lyase